MTQSFHKITTMVHLVKIYTLFIYWVHTLKQ